MKKRYEVSVEYGSTASTDPMDRGTEKDGERVSLAPLDPATALRGLLAVDPVPKSPEDDS